MACYGACLKWMLPELSFSDRWSRGTKLWERSSGNEIDLLSETKYRTEKKITSGGELVSPCTRFCARSQRIWISSPIRGCSRVWLGSPKHMWQIDSASFSSQRCSDTVESLWFLKHWLSYGILFLTRYYIFIAFNDHNISRSSKLPSHVSTYQVEDVVPCPLITTTTTSFITKLTKKFLQYKKSIQKRVIVTQDN